MEYDDTEGGFHAGARPHCGAPRSVFLTLECRAERTEALSDSLMLGGGYSTR